MYEYHEQAYFNMHASFYICLLSPEEFSVSCPITDFGWLNISVESQERKVHLPKQLYWSPCITRALKVLAHATPGFLSFNLLATDHRAGFFQEFWRRREHTQVSPLRLFPVDRCSTFIIPVKGEYVIQQIGELFKNILPVPLFLSGPLHLQRCSEVSRQQKEEPRNLEDDATLINSALFIILAFHWWLRP